MNLLKNKWIPVSPQISGETQQISLQTLLCEDERWELALPRDDMEMSALQLLICMVQVLFPPKDRKEWAKRIKQPLPVDALNAASLEFQDWFQMDHPDYPFMQVKGVQAKFATPMDKLLTGLDTSTNSRFINQSGLAEGVCPGCAAIALYNQSNNAPSFGGGFKFGIRGSCPVSTFIQGDDLRSSIWLNVLTEVSLDEFLPHWRETKDQQPTWIDPIKEKSTISAHNIGFARGLFWGPAHITLAEPEMSGQCSCCGHQSEKLYTGFLKAKFNYTIDGFWEHPHSPQLIAIKKGKPEPHFVSFTQPIPAWTQLSRYVVKRSLDEIGKGEKAQKPALILQQLQNYLGNNAEKLELLAGGYRNNQASIVERRHEMLTLNQGWHIHTDLVHELVEHGLQYKTALRKALFICAKGIKEKNRTLKGTGLDLHEVGESQFYRRSEDLMLQALATVQFEDVSPTYIKLDAQMKSICESIFSELTLPYQHDLELFRTLTVARRRLQKLMKEIRRMALQEKDVA